MKHIKILICSLFMSLGIQAQTYQAPNFKMKSDKSPQAHVKEAKQDEWRSSYRVEDKAQPQRELASEKEKEEWVDYSERETARDPSSVPEPVAPSQHPNVRPWLWSGE